MAIAAEDLIFRLSAPHAKGGLLEPSNGARSLGGFVASSRVPTIKHGLFHAISGDENEARATEYRCVFIHNANRRSVLLSGRVWITAKTEDGADVEIGLDPLDASPARATEPQARAITDPERAPDGVMFVRARQLDDALNLGTLEPGMVRGIWIRRHATGGAPKDLDEVALRVAGDSTE